MGCAAILAGKTRGTYVPAKSPEECLNALASSFLDALWSGITEASKWCIQITEVAIAGVTGTQASSHDPFLKCLWKDIFLCETYHTFLLANSLRFKITGVLISLEVVRFRVSLKRMNKSERVTRWVKFVEMCDTHMTGAYDPANTLMKVRMIGLSENSMLRNTFNHPIYFS